MIVLGLLAWEYRLRSVCCEGQKQDAATAVARGSRRLTGHCTELRYHLSGKISFYPRWVLFHIGPLDLAH